MVQLQASGARSSRVCEHVASREAPEKDQGDQSPPSRPGEPSRAPICRLPSGDVPQDRMRFFIGQRRRVSCGRPEAVRSPEGASSDLGATDGLSDASNSPLRTSALVVHHRVRQASDDLVFTRAVSGDVWRSPVATPGNRSQGLHSRGFWGRPNFGGSVGLKAPRVAGLAVWRLSVTPAQLSGVKVSAGTRKLNSGTWVRFLCDHVQFWGAFDELVRVWRESGQCRSTLATGSRADIVGRISPGLARFRLPPVECGQLLSNLGQFVTFANSSANSTNLGRLRPACGRPLERLDW